VAGYDSGIYTAMSEERILKALPDVLDCTVVVVQHEDGPVTDILLELAADADPDADRTEAVKAAVGETVAATLRKIEAVPAGEVPLTVTGKVRKVALREERLP